MTVSTTGNAPVDWRAQRDQLEHIYAIEDAADELRARRIPMGPAAVDAAAELLGKIHGAPVELQELEEYDLGPGGGIHYRAEIGHRVYRPTIVSAYRDLIRLLFNAGYAEAPYGDFTTFIMQNADGTRGRCSVVIVKPTEDVTR